VFLLIDAEGLRGDANRERRDDVRAELDARADRRPRKPSRWRWPTR